MFWILHAEDVWDPSWYDQRRQTRHMRLQGGQLFYGDGSGTHLVDHKVSLPTEFARENQHLNTYVTRPERLGHYENLSLMLSSAEVGEESSQKVCKNSRHGLHGLVSS